jgi:hypothetical protein
MSGRAGTVIRFAVICAFGASLVIDEHDASNDK